MSPSFFYVILRYWDDEIETIFNCLRKQTDKAFDKCILTKILTE
jgi:hypothetical protein